MSGANPANFSAGQQIANPIYIVDSSGNQITSFGGGTQYTTGAATPGSPIGTMPVFDSGGTIAKVSLAVGLPVNIVGGGGSGGTALADNTAFTAGATNLTPVGGVYNDAVAAATSGDDATVRLSQNRAFHINIRNNAGTELATASNPLQVSQQASASVSGTLQTAQNASANGSTLNVLGMSAAVWTVNMSGFSGTVNFEGSEDGTNFSALSATQLGTTTIGTTTTGSTTTAITVFECSVGGLQLIRGRTSSVSAGTVTVTAHAVPVNFAPRNVNANQVGTWTTTGTKTNNNAAPGATNIGALVGIANVAAPSYTEGDQVLISTDLSGNTRVNVMNANANGQNTMVNSAPVVIASDQSAVANKRSAVAVYSLASTATTSSSNSGDLVVGAYTEIGIDINTTAKTGTTPTIQFTYSRKGADGIYYALWQSAVITNVAANTISTSIGLGMAYNQSLGLTGQLSWVIGGSATPGYTFSANIYGK